MQKGTNNYFFFSEIEVAFNSTVNDIIPLKPKVKVSRKLTTTTHTYLFDGELISNFLCLMSHRMRSFQCFDT